jgi:hypothetical protein
MPSIPWVNSMANPTKKVVIFFCWPFWKIRDCVHIFTNPNSNSCYSKIVLHPKFYIYVIQYTIIANGDARIKNDLCGSCMPKVNGVHKCPFVMSIVMVCKSISSGAHYVTLQKYFSHPSLVIYSFATPHIRTCN